MLHMVGVTAAGTRLASASGWHHDTGVQKNVSIAQPQ